MDMSKDESQGDRRWLGTAGSVRLAVGAASILVIVMEIAGVDLPHWLGAVAIICLLGLIPVTYLPEPWGRRRR